LSMQEEFDSLQSQRDSLQLLVSELLLANHQLRLEVAKLKQVAGINAPATHPQPHPNR
jgi:regulator of replication initiation timing